MARPAVVGRVQRHARRDDLVDAVQHVVAELDVGGGELGFQVLDGAGADDRCAALAAVLAGCSVPAGPGAAGSGSPSATARATPGVPVVLRFGDRVATATLTDTPEARQFAAMLPVTLNMKDVWGQAKSGRLPQVLTVEGTTAIHDPVPGDIYFWPTSDVVAIYYDDLGQTVPEPGLIRLGVIDTGLDGIAGEGRRFRVRIDVAAATTS